MPESRVEQTYDKNITIAIPIVFAALASFIYALRLYARRISVTNFGIDDLLMGIGLLISFGATGSTVWTGFNGAGQPTPSLPKAESRRFNEGAWLLQKFWPTSLAFVKCSIIVFMQRLFRTNRKFFVASTILMVFISLWATSAVLVNIFQCLPVQYFYDKTIKGGHCIEGQTQFFETMGALSLIEDVAIMILPMPIIWKLQMDLRRKLALTIVLSMGSLVCIFSLLRLVYFREFQTSNLSTSSVLEAIFTVLEIDVAIICGCLPAMKPLSSGWLPSFLSHRSRSGGASSSGGKLHSSSNTSRFNKRKNAPREQGSFERIVDLQGKVSHDIYALPHDSDHAIELGTGIGVHTDLRQTSVEVRGTEAQGGPNQASMERQPEEELGFTSRAWPI